MDENMPGMNNAASPDPGGQMPSAGLPPSGGNVKYIVIAVLAILAAGLVFWYMQVNQPQPEVYVPKQNQPAAGSNQSLGAQVYEKQQNPVEGQIPDTNPFNEASNNPIEDTYTNPF